MMNYQVNSKLRLQECFDYRNASTTGMLRLQECFDYRNASTTGKSKNFCYGSLHFIYLLFFIMLIVSTNMYSQPISCPNSPNLWQLQGPIGIQTQAPQRPLNIHAPYYASLYSDCDATIRLSMGAQIQNPEYASYISLTTNANYNDFTSVPSHFYGDLVICSRKISGNYGELLGGNIILTTRDATKSIIFATTSPIKNTEFERQKIYPEGTIDFNIGNTVLGLPKIQLKADQENPTIRLYKMNTFPNNAYPWWIDASANNNIEYLDFKGGNPAEIGQESVLSILTLKMNGTEGFVGVNQTDPIARLQVTNGSVLFDGTVGNVPISGMGTRFMWVPNKSALRAGLVDGSQWDDNNIGNNSVAFGANNFAKGDLTSVFGSNNTANALLSTAFGYNNQALGQNSFVAGQINTTNGEASSAFGLSNFANGDESFIIGTGNSANGNASFSSGYNNIANGDISFVGGNSNTVSSNNSIIFGYRNLATNNTSFIVGSYNNTISGFVIGRGNKIEAGYDGTQDGFAIGKYNICSGLSPIAIGILDTSVGVNSIVIGYNSYAGYGRDYLFPTSGMVFDNSCIAIGDGCQAFGNSTESIGFYSTSMGNKVSTADYWGSFIIGDYCFNPSLPTGTATRNTSINQMTMRFTGSPNDSTDANQCYRFITAVDEDGSPLRSVIFSAHSDGIVKTSDRNLKRNIVQVNENDVLSRLRKVTINYWKWKEHYMYIDSIRVLDSLSNTNMGPMAQDFFRQFPIGFPDSTKLSTSIMEAATMAGVQALANITDTLKNTNDTLKNRISSLNNRIDTLNNTVTTLKNTNDSMNNVITSLSHENGEIRTILTQITDLVNQLSNTIGSTQDCYADITLNQNTPNPFSDNTTITYFIPSKYNSGNTQLIIADATGTTELQTYTPVFDQQGALTIQANNLETGVYVYGVKYSGIIVKSKKILVIK